MAAVLIVDECPANQQSLEAVLAGRGHRVLKAANILEIDDLLRREEPDLLAVDIRYPSMDGCQLILLLRSHFRAADLPIIFLTPPGRETEAIAFARASGVKHVLAKHSPPDAVGRVLQDALDASTSALGDRARSGGERVEETARERSGSPIPCCRFCLEKSDGGHLQRSMENLCREARALLGCRFTAVAVLNGNRSELEQCFYDAVDDATAAQMARLPARLAIFEKHLLEGRTIRWRQRAGNDEEVALAPTEPPIHSFLAAPIPTTAGAIGWLYAVDKIGADEFTALEERIAALLGSQAGTLIAHNSLYSGVMRLSNEMDDAAERLRQSETALQESEQRFRSAFEHTHVGMALISANHQFLRVNGAFTKLLGYSEQELFGKSPSDIVAPDHDARSRAYCEKLLRGESDSFHLEQLFVHKEGRLFWGVNSVSLSRDQIGTPVHFVSQIQDISERKHLEHQIHRAQHRLQQVVASSPAVLFTLPVAGDSLYPNWLSENVRDMFGFDVDEALRPNWWLERVHPEDLLRMQKLTFDLFIRGSVAGEYRFRHRDGHYRWVRSELRLQRDGSGNPLEIVGSWTDITDHKHLEEQFRQSQKMEAIGRLASGMAHDFNNLLTIIGGYTEILGEHFRPGDPLSGFIEQIEKAGDRATSLIRQLLTFSRKQLLLASVLDLNHLLREMEKMLSRLIGEDIDLSFVADPELWRVKADPGHLEQVVMNLVVNARDAMPHGGKLMITTSNVELDQFSVCNHLQSQPGEHVLLAISDTGCGMDDSTKARLFEPFFTTKGPDKGTGLGLATVYGIVKQSGGGIHVQSEVGVGTTFNIHLPRASEELSKSKAPGKASPALRGDETVLLVEDEDGVRTLARVILERQGYKVLEARNGGEALLLCRDYAAELHLTVTDVIMPNMSGGQLVRHLAGLRPHMKVLYLSGYAEEAMLHHGVIDAEAPFLHKPFSAETLTRKVREVLDGNSVTHLLAAPAAHWPVAK